MNKQAFGLSQAQRKRVIESQRYALIQNGYHPHALMWSSTEVQEIRFKQLAQIGIKAGDSVLDVGCGFGDFADYLTRHNTAVKYLGIDVSEELLNEGRQHFPELALVQGDLFDLNPKNCSYDYVVLSGVLNRKFDGALDYAQQTIWRMFETCKKGVAFNLLDARHEWTAGRWDLQSYEPGQVAGWLSDLPCEYSIIDDYLENDFTVYVDRDF